MLYRLRESRKDSTVEVSGPLGIESISWLREAFVKSLDRSTENIAFRPNKVDDYSYACLQLLCSACKSTSMNGKGFLIKGRYAKSIFDMAVNAGFPSKMCREKKCESCCLVGANHELLERAS